jgi:hypothetical protein
VTIPPISLGWKAVQERIVSSCALVLEARKTDGDCFMDEVKIVPDKLVVEDKCVVHYSIDEPKTEPDKLYNFTTKAVTACKRLKKYLIRKKNYFFQEEEKCSTDSSSLLIFHQNIYGLRKKQTF